MFSFFFYKQKSAYELRISDWSSAVCSSDLIVFDAFFTPFETRENQAGLYGVPKGRRISDELPAAVHLSDKRDAYARTLSGGMKRRLLVAKAMVHSPPIIVLDEPTENGRAHV